jgi:HEPN domain-containing protein
MEPGDAAEWLLHAESDLAYAKLGQTEPAILRNQVAFCAEQAAEKAFKAVLVHAAVEFSKHMICRRYCFCFGTPEFQ